MQKMESQLDEIGQRGLKGMVVCSAHDFKYVEGRKIKIPSLFEGMKTLKPEEGEIATKEEELMDLNKVLALNCMRRCKIKPSFFLPDSITRANLKKMSKTALAPRK